MKLWKEYGEQRKNIQSNKKKRKRKTKEKRNLIFLEYHCKKMNNKQTFHCVKKFFAKTKTSAKNCQSSHELVKIQFESIEPMETKRLN